MTKLLHHISEGNSKTECFSFDLPAEITCPGMTAECGNKCYAAMLMRIYPAVDAKYTRNLELTNSAEFVAYMITTIPYACEFRIHVSGDFKDEAYIRDWIKIVAARRDVTFYAYTRSWRFDDMWEAIKDLQSFSHVNVNLSVDDETGMPTMFYADMFRWCYLTDNDTVPSWMRRKDIVFRSNHLGHKKRRKNDVRKGLNPNVRAPLVKRLGRGSRYEDKAQVCPMEQGQDIPNFSCKKCRLCVDKLEELIGAV
jgi:hypothetical protein